MDGIIAYDAMIDHAELGPRIRERAGESGVTMASSAVEVVKDVDYLFVAVPAVNAQDVYREIVSDLRAGQVYIDVCATTPAVKEELTKGVEQAGAVYVDAAMLGSLPLNKHRVPITASGTGAARFHEEMSAFGMQIKCISSQAGAASAVKLIRSIFMKGIASLMFEMLEGAQEYDVIDEVVESISKSMDGIPFESHLNRLVTGTAVHAARRAAELQGSVQMLADCDIDNVMAIAAKHKHELVAQLVSDKMHSGDIKGYRDTITAMHAASRN